MIGQIERVMLEETTYDYEPLHGLIYGLVSHGVCKGASEVVNPLLDLLQAGYLEARYHSSEFGWTAIRDVNREHLERDLLEYIQRNEAGGFKTYPSGKEYYFKTTDSGVALLDE